MKPIPTSSLFRVAMVAAAILVISVHIASAQDFTVKMKDDGGRITTHYISRNAVRITSSGAPAENDLIYKLDTGKIITVDSKQKTYSEGSIGELQKLTQGKLATLSPQQQELMKSMGYGGTATVKKIGAGETILGYATEKYSFTTPLAEGEISVASMLPVPLGYYDTLSSFVAPTGGGIGLIYKELEAQHINGFILKLSATVKSSPQVKGIASTQVATSVDKLPLPATTFEPLAGYKKVTH